MLEKQIKPSGGPKGINKKCVNLKNDPFLVQIILISFELKSEISY